MLSACACSQCIRARASAWREAETPPALFLRVKAAGKLAAGSDKDSDDDEEEEEEEVSDYDYDSDETGELMSGR